MSVGERVHTRPRNTAAPAAPRAFRADIQGLRALAIVLVLLDHAGVPLVGGGFVGVDVFFVISGFLISGHLVRELHGNGRINFLRFYAARTRRILPAALATITATAIAAYFVVSPLRITEILQDGIAATLYVPNVLFAVRQTDYLAGTAPSPFQHFWSLGVEEQFYLLWPLVLLAAFLLSRRSHRALLVTIAAVAILSFAASVTGTADAPSLAFFSPHTRAWEFAVGALLAGAAPALARVPAALAQVLGWAGLVMILGPAIGYSAGTAYPGSAALLPVIGTALVIGCGGRGTRGPGVLLSLRPVQFLGMISYSLYLVHWPILVLVHEGGSLGGDLPVSTGLVLAALSVPVAWLVYRSVEMPFRRPRPHGPRSSRRLLAVSTATSLVLVASLFAATTAAAQLPLASDRVAFTATAAPLPAGTRFVPLNITPTLASATKDTGAIYTNGCQQNLTGAAVLTCSFGALDSGSTIALFGDSHAGRWFPALEQAAAQLGYRLDTYTKSGCRSEETVAAWDTAADPACSRWRTDVVAMLDANPPDVIVLTNHLGPKPDQDPTVLQADWTEGLSQLYTRLPASSRIITIADSPEFTGSPVLCLSSHLENAQDCAVPRGDALNPSIRAAQRAAAASSDRAAVIDLTDYFCNGASCPTVIGSSLVYSDEHHLTATFSRTLALPLQQALSAHLAPAP